MKDELVEPVGDFPAMGPSFDFRFVEQRASRRGVGQVRQHMAQTSPVAPGFETIAEAIAEVIRRLPELRMPDGHWQAAEDAANDVIAELGQPTSRVGVIKRCLLTIQGALSSVRDGALEGVGEDGAQEIIDLIAGLC